MNTAFYNVALDSIRYSVVWENHQTLRTALVISPEDHVLVITSAGCNVLNTLLSQPRAVTAVDMNPVQNRLLKLKIEIIRHHSYALYRGVLGLDGPNMVEKSVDELLPTLTDSDRSFWKHFFTEHPSGLLTAGRLEQYLHGFYETLPSKFQEALVSLIQCPTVEAQAEWFSTTLDVPDFYDRFITYFDDRNLSKGRDPRLYQYVRESSGALFYQRLKAFVQQHPLTNNFHFLFFFFGLRRLTDQALPPCYQEAHYLSLRASLDRLQIVTDEAISYLLSDAGTSITKAGLSNIFEYTSHHDFGRSIQALANREGGFRLVFWNLLNKQGSDRRFDQWRESQLDASLLQQETCFYFGSIRVFTLPRP